MAEERLGVRKPFRDFLLLIPELTRTQNAGIIIYDEILFYMAQQIALFTQVLLVHTRSQGTDHMFAVQISHGSHWSPRSSSPFYCIQLYSINLGLSSWGNPCTIPQMPTPIHAVKTHIMIFADGVTNCGGGRHDSNCLPSSRSSFACSCRLSIGSFTAIPESPRALHGSGKRYLFRDNVSTYSASRTPMDAIL